MSRFVYFAASVIETLLRLFPFPAGTGLVVIGNPDRSSPVLLTCNYHLTVMRVKRALRGMNAYLLVANSHGINVWCASAGGLLNNHSIISVLKTSGVEKLVDHRNVILPQLAATGVEHKVIKDSTGWKITFGPVYIEDLKTFLESGKKDATMRKVRFDILQRFEMAVAWAFPLSVVAAIIMLPFWPDKLVITLPLIWGLSLLIFLTFTLYSRWLKHERKTVGLIFFDFRQNGFLLIIWGIFMLGLILWNVFSGEFYWGSILPWVISSFVILLVLSMDLMGSTPIYKSSLHEEGLFKITLDKQKCRGAGFCQDVCPRDCFQVEKERHTAAIVRARFCVQCGACIVQCPFDALCFRAPNGDTILPKTIREYKLNLMGKRTS
jgi:NAD-dependent dihydropyrimidine dehydrogenase PreA subunit